ncbi:MAG TPA: prepilin peptidase [Pirellulales bacterium]
MTAPAPIVEECGRPADVSGEPSAGALREAPSEPVGWSNPRVRRTVFTLLAIAALWPAAATWGNAPAAWRTAQIGLLLGVLAEAVYTDFAEGLIRNSLTVPAIILAAALAGLADATRLGEWLAGSPYQSSDYLSPVGLGGAALGALAAVAAPLFMFLFGSGGGGDVKLAFAVGLLLGWPTGVVAIAVTYLAAAVGGAAWVALTGRLWKMLAVGTRTLASRAFPAHVVAPIESEKQVLRTAVPMAPFFAIGALAAIVERGLAP